MAQATAAPGSAHSAVAKENKKAIQARNLRTGLLFTAPALIVLAIFVFYPAIKTFITSLTSDRINRAGKFVGFDNYVKLFQSADFWTDVKNTLVYAVAYAPIVVIVALAFALLLNRKELNKIQRALQDRGLTVVGLRLFLNERGLAKVVVGLARGRKAYDKREYLKENDAKREMDKAMKKYRA